MRIALIVVLFLCGTLAHAAPLAPYSCGAGEAYAVDVGGGTEGALGYGFAVASAETGCGEKWRMHDMQTPTASSHRENIALVRGFFENKSIEEERQSIYSFVIDSRDICSTIPLN